MRYRPRPLGIVGHPTANDPCRPTTRHDLSAADVVVAASWVEVGKAPCTTLCTHRVVLQGLVNLRRVLQEGWLQNVTLSNCWDSYLADETSCGIASSCTKFDKVLVESKTPVLFLWLFRPQVIVDLIA